MTIQSSFEGSQRAEFEAWLQKNEAHLVRYEAWEVARLALSCGFTMAEIAPRVVDWLSKSQRWLKLWQNPFAEQWACLSAYGRGEEWENKGEPWKP